MTDATLYALANITEKAFPFLILPIISRALSAEDMGKLVLFQTITVLVMPLLNMSFDNAIFVKYFKSASKLDFVKYVSSCLALLIPIFLIVIIGSITFAFTWVASADVRDYFILCVLMACGQSLCQIALSILRAQKKVTVYVTLSMSMAFAKGGFGLSFLFCWGSNWSSVATGQVLGIALVALCGCLPLLSRLFSLGEVGLETLKEAVKFGVPITIHRLGAWMLIPATQLLLGVMVSSRAVGLLAIASVFSSVLVVCNEAITKAFVPYIYEALSDEGRQKGEAYAELRLWSLRLYVTYALLAIALTLFGLIAVDTLFGSVYLESRQLIPALMIAAFFNSAYKIHVDIISYTGRTHLIASSTVVVGAVNVVLSCCLIWIFGLFGASAALMLSSGLLYATVYVLSNKMVPIFNLPKFLSR